MFVWQTLVCHYGDEDSPAVRRRKQAVNNPFFLLG